VRNTGQRFRHEEERDQGIEEVCREDDDCERQDGKGQANWEGKGV